MTSFYPFINLYFAHKILSLQRKTHLKDSQEPESQLLQAL